MRFPPNLKYFFFTVIVFTSVILGAVYLPKIIPNIGNILTAIVVVAMFVLIGFVFIKPFISFLYARADDILKIYVDANEKGLHIFTCHLNSSGEGYGNYTRDILHYFIIIETGKLYFKKLFSHDMTPTAGRSGWGDFYSFEESVLNTKYLQSSLEKLSQKSTIQLQLGREIKSFDENQYDILIGNFSIAIKKYENIIDEGYNIQCSNKELKQIIWKRKI